MARLRTEPITAEHISQYLAAQDDFALELRALRLAQGLGYQVTHGGTYVDPVTNKPRQFDLRISKVMGNRKIFFPIECKSIQSNCPLLVSRIPRKSSEEYHNIIALRSNNIPPHSVLRRSSFYHRDQPVGKATAQIGRYPEGRFTSSDGDTHDKWMQALASAAELIKQDLPPRHAEFNGQMSMAYIPILLVSNGTLWVVDYDNNGEVCSAPNQVDEATLFVGREYDANGQSFKVSHLHFCTEIGLQSLLTAASENGIWLDGLFDA